MIVAGAASVVTPGRNTEQLAADSELATENPVVVVAAPTPARRDNLAHALASSSSPFRVIAWTPERSPLAALREALPLAHTDPSVPQDPPNGLAPPPAPHA